MSEGQTPAIDLLNIPDLATDGDIVAVVDELKHRLRSGARGKWSGIRAGLDRALSQFVRDHGLDQDDHMHASLPKRPQGLPWGRSAG